MGKPHGIMLREKDMDDDEYEKLASNIMEVCKVYSVPLLINQNMKVAQKLKNPNIHLSMTNLRNHYDEIDSFVNIGASVHTVSEAVEAVSLGATYLIAGHIFSTDSKKGVPPRGLTFLKNVCESVTVPVFAIGGIKRNHVHEIKAMGAKGVCIMSEAMTSEEPVTLSQAFR